MLLRIDEPRSTQRQDNCVWDGLEVVVTAPFLDNACKLLPASPARHINMFGQVFGCYRVCGVATMRQFEAPDINLQ